MYKELSTYWSVELVLWLHVPHPLIDQTPGVKYTCTHLYLTLSKAFVGMALWVIKTSCTVYMCMYIVHSDIWTATKCTFIIYILVHIYMYTCTCNPSVTTCALFITSYSYMYHIYIYNSHYGTTLEFQYHTLWSTCTTVYMYTCMYICTCCILLQ